MNIKEDCIHLKCRILRVLNFCSQELEQRPVYDQCALNLISPYWGCSSNCASYESKGMSYPPYG